MKKFFGIALVVFVAGCGSGVIGQTARSVAIDRCVELGNTRASSIALADSIQDVFNRGFAVYEMNSLIVTSCGNDSACSGCGFALTNALK